MKEVGQQAFGRIVRNDHLSRQANGKASSEDQLGKLRFQSENLPRSEFPLGANCPAAAGLAVKYRVGVAQWRDREGPDGIQPGARDRPKDKPGIPGETLLNSHGIAYAYWHMCRMSLGPGPETYLHTALANQREHLPSSPSPCLAQYPEHLADCPQQRAWRKHKC